MGSAARLPSWPPRWGSSRSPGSAETVLRVVDGSDLKIIDRSFFFRFFFSLFLFLDDGVIGAISATESTTALLRSTSSSDQAQMVESWQVSPAKLTWTFTCARASLARRHTVTGPMRGFDQEWGARDRGPACAAGFTQELRRAG